MELQNQRAGKVAGDVDAMVSQELASFTAASILVALALGVGLIELAPRCACEHREVPAPSRDRPRIRLVLDGSPVWEGGWDATLAPSPFDEPHEQRVTGWAWRERWFDARFGS